MAFSRHGPTMGSILSGHIPRSPRVPILNPVFLSAFSLRILNRTTVIASSVLVFHLLALWTLQSGLLRRAVEAVIPVQLLSELITPPQPKPIAPPPPLPPPVAPPPPRAAKTPPPPSPAPQPPPAPTLLATANAPATPNAPTGVTTAPVALPPIGAPVSVAPVPPPPAPSPVPAPPPAAPPAPPPKVELPSSDADYLKNPSPVYPAISKRLGEQGKVLVRVLIGTDGTAQKAELRQSSGFDRLDQSALNAVLKWQYVPGKRGGVAEAMWFVVPINFTLE